MPTDLDPVATLRRTDPAAAGPVPARPALDELPAVPGLPPARRPRMAALAAAVVLVVALVGVAIAVSSDRGERTPVATDPTPTEAPPTTGPDPLGAPPALIPLAAPQPARPHLLALAERAATDGAPADPGEVAYRRSVSWNRPLAVGGGDVGEVDEIVPESAHRESWIAGDGAGRVEIGEGPAVRRGEVGQTDVDPPRPTAVETTPWDDAYVDPADLPDDPAVVDLYLQVDNGPSSDFVYVLERAAALLGERPRTGADRALVLRRLAEIDAVEFRGEVTDRAGRTSLAFSAASDFSGALSEVVILLDPETGAVHGREDVQLEGTAEMPIDGPTLRWSETVLAVANVGSPGERP